jgi:hypothetical protein
LPKHRIALVEDHAAEIAKRGAAVACHSANAQLEHLFRRYK